MPRVARQKDENGIYHIIQKSSLGQFLFESPKDREFFIQNIYKFKEIYGFEIYAICVQKSNEYHLVIGTYGSDISKIMKSINISYRAYKNCPNPLYKDRYKSFLLREEDEFYKCVLAIKKEGSITSSDCRVILQNCIKNKIKIMSKDEVKNFILEKTIEIEKEGKSLDKEARNIIIKEVRKNSDLTLKEIGEIFNLGESTISKILK